jgi:hypothetical protein
MRDEREERPHQTDDRRREQRLIAVNDERSADGVRVQRSAAQPD